VSEHLHFSLSLDEDLESFFQVHVMNDYTSTLWTQLIISTAN